MIIYSSLCCLDSDELFTLNGDLVPAGFECRNGDEFLLFCILRMSFYSSSFGSVSMMNGGCRQAMQWIRHPKAQMSTLKSKGYFLSISGLVYSGVPTLLMKTLLFSLLATEMEIPMSAILKRGTLM